MTSSEEQKVQLFRSRSSFTGLMKVCRGGGDFGGEGREGRGLTEREGE